MKVSVVKKTGDARREEILDTTIEVLANEGYSSVSMRGIAERIGIHLATLQYYFPTKRDLLKSTIERSISCAVRETDELLSTSNSDPIKILRKALKAHLNACRDPTICKLFVALWGMSSHDEDVSYSLSEFYHRDCQRYAALIKNANPKLSVSVCNNMAILILAQLEGLVLFISPGKPFENKYRVIEKQFWSQLDAIIGES